MATISLVRDIVQKSSTASSEQLERHIEEVKTRARQVEEDLLQLVRQNYEEFDRFFSGLADLSEEVDKVQIEYSRVSQQIENDTMVKLLESSGKKQEIGKKLEETNLLIEIVSSLDRVCKALEKFGRISKVGSLSEAANEVSVAWDSLATLKSLIPSAKIVSSLTSELAECTSNLHTTLAKEAAKVFMWSSCPTSPSNVDESLSVSLVLSKPADSSFFNALSIASKLKGHSKSFSSLISTRLVSPLILWPGLKMLEKCGHGNKITLSLSTRQTSASGSAHLLSVLEDLTCLFQHIAFVVPEVHREEWMAEMGGVLFPKLTNMLKERILVPLLPHSYGLLKEYCQLFVPLERFEKMLVELQLVGSGYNALSQYVSDADKHFVVKQNQELLSLGRACLLKPLLATRSGTLIRVGAESVVTRDPSMSGLSSMTASFPQCLISSFVKEFTDLMVSTVNSEALDKTQAAVSARLLVDLYLSIMPARHGDLVKQNTRAAIVYHNNHLYLADQLTHINLHIQQQSTGTTSKSFVDLVPILRYQGEKVFLDAMLKEKEGILECLKKSSGLGSSADEIRHSLLSKYLQQALKFVSDFHSLAEGTLPPAILEKCLASLLDVIIVWLADGVVELEDISAKEADVLYDFVVFVMSQGPKSAHMSRETAPSRCLHWGRLEDVGFVLHNNLQEIVAYWMGPKSKSLKASEFRSMIRGLFQNTDKRATALSKIK